MPRRVCNAWLLAFCLPARKERLCNLGRHRGVQLGGAWGVGVHLRAYRARSHVAQRCPLSLPAKPLAKTGHLPLRRNQGLLWLTNGCRMKGCCLFNARLLLHTLKLLCLELLFRPLAKHSLPQAARVALSRRQSPVLLLHKLVDHVVRDAILRGGLCNKDLIHLL